MMLPALAFPWDNQRAVREADQTIHLVAALDAPPVAIGFRIESATRTGEYVRIHEETA